MNNTRSSGKGLLKPAAIVVGVMVLIALAAWYIGGAGGSQSSAEQSGRAADHVYTVRGEIRMLPSPGRPTSQLVLHHEAINDFANPDGTKGMSSMEMPFPAAPKLTFEGLVVGDAVEFELSVWRGPDGKSIDAYRVTRMTKLPAETKLRFGEAAPTLGEPAEK